MVLPSRQPGLLLILLLSFNLLQACNKKESREAEPAAVDAGEQTEPYRTTQDVKVRSGPGTRYKIIADIKSGTKVNVAAHENGWLKVVSRQGRPPGYIDERFARPMAAEAQSGPKSPVQGTYTTTADVIVREQPGLHYKAVAKIKKGIEVNVVGSEGDWLKIQSKHGRPPGYIEKSHAEPGRTAQNDR
jgi:uncharacterized protein YgiM (DUF1202 family)